MSLSHLSLEHLTQALSLLKEREAIQSQLAKIKRELEEIENGNFSNQENTDQPKVQASVKRRRRRKNVEQAVLKALRKAGAKGLNVKELAFRAKVKATSLRTWLYTKGKSIEDIVNKGNGIFAQKAN